MKAIIILLFLICGFGIAGAQGNNGGPVYQDLLVNNPALSGSEGDGVLRLSYINFYPGNHYNLNSAQLTYDSWFEELHGGTAFHISENYLGGIINDIAGGFSYAYFLQAGKTLFINAGLSASVFHRGYNFGNAILPDQIDPVGGASLPSGQVLDTKGKTLLDLAAGFLITSGKFSGGFSINHLSEPEISSSAISTDRLKRRYTLHVSGNLNLNSRGILRIQPLLLAFSQGGYFSAGGGAALGSDRFAINSLLFADNAANLNIQSGFSFSFSVISVFYSYRFNAISGNEFLPLSLLHEVGLAFNLYNVEKRKASGTINFPKM